MKIQANFNLAPSLWYQLGGTAKQFIQVKTKDELVSALEKLQVDKEQKYFLCGMGSNLIFAAEYFDGVVIQIGKSEQKDIMVSGDEITAYAGEVLDDVITTAFANSLTGFEWAGGLPGTIGAAVRGNVGAFGGEIKDNFVSAEVLEVTESGTEKKILTFEQMRFVYRGSVVKDNRNLIILSSTFSFKKAEQEELIKAKAIYTKNKQFRIDHHPLEYPNCGSVFKNLREKEQINKVLAIYPDLQEMIEKKWYGKVAVAPLIERLGLKGYRVGNAQISEKHALFIINLGGAKASDVLQIIGEIQAKFKNTFGFELETEVEIVS